MSDSQQWTDRLSQLGIIASFGLLLFSQLELFILCLIWMIVVQIVLNRRQHRLAKWLLVIGVWIIATLLSLLYGITLSYLVSLAAAWVVFKSAGLVGFGAATLLSLVLFNLLRAAYHYTYLTLPLPSLHMVLVVLLVAVIVIIAIRTQQITQDTLIQDVLDSQNELVCRYLPDTTLTYVNPAYARTYNSTPQALIGTRFIEHIPINERKTVQDYIKDLIKNRHIGTIEHATIVQGQLRWHRWYDQVINHKGYIELQGFGYDITKQHLLAQELKRSEAKYRAIVEDLTDLVCRFTKDGRLTFVNQAYCDYFQMKPEDLIGKAFTPLIPEEDQIKVIQNIRKINRNQPAITHEYRVILPNGDIRWIQWTNRLILSYQNEPLEFQGVGRDITVLKEAETALKQSELRLRKAFENNNDAVFFIDLNGVIVDCNPRAIEMLGYERDEIIGRLATASMMQVDTQDSTQIFQRLLKGEKVPVYERLFRHKDGHIIPTEINAVLVLDEHDRPSHIQSIIRDISERKAAEKIILEQINQLRALMANIPNGGIALFDTQYRHLQIGGSILTFTGYNTEDLVGKTLFEMFSPIVVESLLPIYDAALNGKDITTEIDFDDRFYLISAHPVYNDTNIITGGVVIAIDITKRKEAEQTVEYLNNELVTYTLQLENAINELKAFSYSVSHDLRAPLRAIRRLTEELLEEYQTQLSNEVRDKLKHIQLKLEQMYNIIRDLLSLSRISHQPLYIKPVNLSHIVQEIVTSLQQQTPDYHHTTFVIQPDLIARCDEGLIRIMLQNLLENAWKFTRERANARIEFGSVPQSHPTVYYIKDNGIGFDPQYADDLFHAFRKLHVGYDGSGIGLATVQRIINRHGGEIWAEASPGKGATFYFKLL